MARTSTPAYSTVHRRLRSILGPARDQICMCGRVALDWSYDSQDPDEFVAEVKVFNGYRNYMLTLAYSDKPEHYAPKCRPCHRAYDRAYRASLEERLWLL